MLHKTFTIDIETTTHNKGHYFDPRNSMVSYSFKRYDEPTPTFVYYTDPDFKRDFHLCSTTLVGFNLKFDIQYLEDFNFPLEEVDIWDCQLAEYVYNAQVGGPVSLNECLLNYGLPTKLDKVKEYWEAGVDTIDIPVNILEEYNNWDVIQTEALYKVQQSLLSDEQKRLVLLMGKDLLVLSHAEKAGLLYDSDGAREYIRQISKEIEEIESKLSAYLPKIEFGKFNWDSGDHLSALLYGGTLGFDYSVPTETVYKSGPQKGQPYVKNNWHVENVHFNRKYTPPPNTELKKTKGKQTIIKFYSTAAGVLRQLRGKNLGLVELVLERAQKIKIIEMLQSIEDLFSKYGWQDNYIHGRYNQNITITGRLSSSGPNMQNWPETVKKLIRSRYVD